MSERTDYAEGVPCWVDTLQPDPQAAMDFYGQLFGWEFSGPEPTPAGHEYFVARLRGRDVAGIGALPANAPAYWNTYIRVQDADATAQRATAQGGQVLIDVIDASPAGRLAAISDPTGVPFALWEARERAGAQLVNEPNTWTMSALHTPDTIVAAGFYRSLFGWDTAPIAPDLLLSRLPDYAGESGQPIPADTVAAIKRTADGVPPNWSVEFRVHDADRTA